MNYSADWHRKSLFLQECRGLGWRMGAFIDTSIWETLILPPSSHSVISLLTTTSFLSVHLHNSFFILSTFLIDSRRLNITHLISNHASAQEYLKYCITGELSVLYSNVWLFFHFFFFYSHYMLIKIKFASIMCLWIIKLCLDCYV